MKKQNLKELENRFDFYEMARKMYTRVPNFGKRLMEITWAIIPPAIKYGKKYRHYTKLLNDSQWWNKKQLEVYQIKKLKETLLYAAEYVPFYKKVFMENGFNAESFSTFSELEKLPLIDKDVVLTNGKDMVSKQFPLSKLKVHTTGGTTGKQLRLYITKNAYTGRELPFVDAIWGRVGYDRYFSHVAQLRNHRLENGKIWEYDWKNRVLIFDAYHMDDKNIGIILRKITECKVEFLHTYPSSALILCDFIKRKGIKYNNSLKVLLLTSENIYAGQKETIEKYMNAKCFTFYGHSEGAALAGQCECSEKYHIQSEYGYIELVDEDGKVIKEPNKIGEIVCTGFDNKAMPLIRYRTGDFASYSEKATCACGRHYTLLDNIVGRWTQEMFIGKTGNKISMTALNMHTDIFKNVENYQFIQDIPGKCSIRVVKNDNYSLMDEKNIFDELQKKFDNSMEIKFEYVKEIEKTMRGKQRFIIQNIKDEELI
ncbi:MAG: phenylacetate--CoA ligase family protein [Lachnospiraceae bacterium]|nr:phenylacetate--CoA ligase family protein [Lachnospiraceae bacterium]